MASWNPGLVEDHSNEQGSLLIKPLPQSNMYVCMYSTYSTHTLMVQSCTVKTVEVIDKIYPGRDSSR